MSQHVTTCMSMCKKAIAMKFSGEEKTRLALLKLFIVAKISLSISCSPIKPEEMITALLCTIPQRTNERELLAAAPCSVLGGVVLAEIGRKTPHYPRRSCLLQC